MKRIALSVIFVAVTSICSGQWLEREVVIGDTFGGISLTGGIVVNPISGNVYIESNPIQVFSPVTMEKLRGPRGSGLVAFFSSSDKGCIIGEESLLILDAAADTVVGVTALPSPTTTKAYSPASDRLYLGSDEDERLLVFDPAGDSVLQIIDMGAAVLSLLWDSTRNRLYVGTDANSGQLKVVDCSADTLLAQVELGITDVSALALSTASRKLYCAGLPDSTVVVVSADSLAVLGVVPGLSALNIMVHSPVTDRLYCPHYTTLFIVDCRSDTIRATRQLPYAVPTVSSLSGKVYLCTDSARVVIMDTTDSVVGSVQIPAARTDRVAALAFRPDRNQLYGVTEGDVVFTIDASVDMVAGWLSYASYQPRQMVHNPAANKLYLLCPSQDDILVMDSTFGAVKHIIGGATDSDALPVLNSTLNRLYVADAGALRIIDCNSDSLIESKRMYGIGAPIPVMVPYLNKVFVFEGGGGADSVYAYDCLRNTVASVFYLSDAAPSAVFDPRTNRVYFACEDAPTIRALNPSTGNIDRTFDLVGGSYRGRMALDVDLGRLYYTDQSPNMMFTIDLLADSVMVSETLPWDIDTMFLDRRLGKLYLCSRDTTSVLVFDCGRGTVVDTIAADFHYAGLLDEINDKLYLRYGAVVDCRYDSVVTTLPESLNPRSMAWDAIDNRVFQATTSRLYVYRDGPYGIEEQQPVVARTLLTLLGNPAHDAVSISLQIPPGQTGALTVFDAAGRRVHSSFGLRTSSFDIDLSSMSAGIYFVSLEVGRTRTTDKVILQH